MLNDAAKLKITEIAKKRGLEFVVLFGSTARKTNRKDSDIDIAALSKKPADISIVTEEMGNVLKRNDVEVADLSHASPYLMRAVVEDGILLFESKKGAFLEWKVYAQNIWYDTAWIRAKQKAALKSWADNYQSKK